MRIASIARFWQATRMKSVGVGLFNFWAVGCGLWEDLLVVSARVGEGGVRTPGGQLYVRTAL